MLPRALLSFDLVHGTLVPRYLTARSEVWIRVVLEEMDGLVGRTAKDVDEAFSARIAPRARAVGASARALAGVRHILGRIWRLAMVAPLPPVRVRQVAYEQAVRGPGGRDEAIDRAACILGSSREEVLASLFADRPEDRCLAASAAPQSPREVLERYNLALVQGLVLSAREVTVHAREHVRAVVRYAKLKRLLCTYGASEGGTLIHLSGPLSVLRRTTKYGHSLASFLPAVVSTPGWSLEARCEVAGREGLLRASSSDPLARTHALPRDADSNVERRLVRDVRRLGSAWTIERETDAIQVAGRLFFPDFTLRRGLDRVLVEIVGFYTPEYLASKLSVLRAAGLDGIIVCVDESLACSGDDIVAGAVLRYRQHVDATQLLAAADRIASGGRVA